MDGRIDLAAGRMNVENDFASSPLYCNYMNNVLCGDPKAAGSGLSPQRHYPDGVWGGRDARAPDLGYLCRGGVYEVSQGLYGDDFRTGKLRNIVNIGIGGLRPWGPSCLTRR